MKDYDKCVMLKPIGYCLCGDSIFFIQRDMNMLVEISKDLKKIKMVKRLSNKMCGMRALDIYNDFCIYANNCIYIFANGSNNVSIYDLQEQKLKTYVIANKKESVFLHKAIFIEGNSFVLLPNGGTQKIYFDLNSKVCAYENMGNDKDIFLEECYAIESDKYIFTDSSGNNIHVLDAKFHYLNSIQIGKNNRRYWGIAIVGDYYVLPWMEGQGVTIYNKKKEEYLELFYPDNYISKKGYGYSSMYTFESKVYIFPLFANMILSIDVEQMTVQQEFAEENISVKYNKNKTEIIAETYIDSLVIDDNVVVYEDMLDCWHKFNCKNNTVEVVRLLEEQEQNYIDELRLLFSSNTQECIIKEGFGPNNLDNFIFSLKIK